MACVHCFSCLHYCDDCDGWICYDRDFCCYCKDFHCRFYKADTSKDFDEDLPEVFDNDIQS